MSNRNNYKILHGCEIARTVPSDISSTQGQPDYSLEEETSRPYETPDLSRVLSEIRSATRERISVES